MINLLIGLCFSVPGDSSIYKIHVVDPNLNYAIVARSTAPEEPMVVYPKNVLMGSAVLVKCLELGDAGTDDPRASDTEPRKKGRNVMMGRNDR